MSRESINIVVNNEVLNVPIKTLVVQALGAEDNLDIVGGLISNEIVSLHTPLSVPVSISPITRNSREGRQLVNRTSTILLEYVLATKFKDYFFQLGQAMGQGYYYALRSAPKPLEEVDYKELSQKINEALQKAIEDDLQFHSKLYNVETACVLLKDHQGSMLRLLETWPYAQVLLTNIGHFYVIQHGPIAPSSKYCCGLRILPYEQGFILQFSGKQPNVAPNAHRRLLDTYRENRSWNEMIGVSSVGDLNESVLSGHISEVIRVQEGLHEKKIIEIADLIAKGREKLRLICIAGPSSSGKTTFSKRLSVQLRVAGVDPVPISLDDYYRNRDDRPRDAQGNIDFEALECLDIPLLTEHLQALVRGERILEPHYDFKKGVRVPPEKFTPLQLAPNQVLLIEGIHGLNPAITESVPQEARFRIFVSALTQLTVDEHTRISTSNTRLLRRIVRDRRYRGTSAADTIERWPSVRRGEQRNIFPFQEHCDVMFNSSLIYETAILKTFAWRYLLEVPRTHPSRITAQSLLRFLDMFVPIFPDDIPSNSILREFIGGSNFAY